MFSGGSSFGRPLEFRRRQTHSGIAQGRLCRYTFFARAIASSIALALFMVSSYSRAGS